MYIVSTLDKRMRTFNCPTRFSRRKNDFLVKGGTVHNSLFHSFVPIRDRGSPIAPTRQRRVFEHEDWNDRRRSLRGIALNIVHPTNSHYIALIKLLSYKNHYDSATAFFSVNNTLFQMHRITDERERHDQIVSASVSRGHACRTTRRGRSLFSYFPCYVIHLNYATGTNPRATHSINVLSCDVLALADNEWW